jgi:hypothetical protein
MRRTDKQFLDQIRALIDANTRYGRITLSPADYEDLADLVGIANPRPASAPGLHVTLDLVTATILLGQAKQGLATAIKNRLTPA